MLVRNSDFASLKSLFNTNNIFNFIAGPCAIEDLHQMEKVAQFLVHNNIPFIRGGAYKPRTSPYDFQGLGIEGLKILDNIRKQYHLFALSEIMDPRDVEYGIRYTDIIQIGSRNMTNYSLLREVGKTKHPVLLKRGMMSTYEEFLLAAEYIASNGNNNIIMCERGIRTFETLTRNTLDISCIAMLKSETHLPVIVDLSHSLGRKDIVLPIMKCLISLDIDGVMLEVHPEPEKAKSDSRQQFNLEEFENLLKALPR